MMMIDNEIFVHDFQNGFGKFILYGIEFDLLVRLRVHVKIKSHNVRFRVFRSHGL